MAHLGHGKGGFVGRVRVILVRLRGGAKRGSLAGERGVRFLDGGCEAGLRARAGAGRRR